ncbi:putative RES domain protein [Vibrio nigripulchritudo SOn1]|uniref:RES domain protein n=1 Tax=Vibrio nigripulchritudo SOn1 TaxID=1238450 RepID=A0AAV2VYK0_9VIBR|nr:RES family NAD+ phosphorylase [Vibrio nigripulchritudo]CCO49864.1 putative RES domain protein [Vibrio nigripulchritudo SOn1]
MKECKDKEFTNEVAFRLIPSKYPPIALFDDVADEEEFAALYAIQELTNPRIQNELGNLTLVDPSEIPFGIAGCSYAVAPFVHISGDGGRFNDAQFGAFYCAENMETAISEVSYHQVRYLNNIENCPFEVITYRGLECQFTAKLKDLTSLPMEHDVYSKSHYSAGQQIARELKQSGSDGVTYFSVRARKPEEVCFALFAPRLIQRIVQAAHFESFYSNGAITKFEKVSPCNAEQD